MGTNYYAVVKHPIFEEEEVHIGKSSNGWCFSLRIYPEKGINTLDDWMKVLHNDDIVIINEYKEVFSLKDLHDIITNRPEDSLRHKIGGFCCTGHGEGTWDYVAGEFC